MNLRETLELLNNVMMDSKDLIKNEESTKQFLILPLLRGLGYDVYNPKEVTPEFTADFHKNKEKVDYAIYLNGAPKIFIEAKPLGTNISKNAPQLSRYFSTFPNVRLGILTNGLEYHFYTDLNNANLMDSKPFFTFHITEYSEEDFNYLVKFSKNLYDYENIKTMAQGLIYFQSFKSVIKEILDNPNDEFIRFVIKERFHFKVTQQFINSSRPIVQKCIQEALSEIITEKFESSPSDYSALDGVAAAVETASPEKKVYYAAEDIQALGTYEEFEGVKVVLPSNEVYQRLLKIPIEEYSIEKGNPQSDFFVSSVLMQGSAICGYLIGQYYNQKQDTTLYPIKSNEITKFLSENPIVKEFGFINARLGFRTNKANNEKLYYMKSCLPNLSFKEIPNLVSKVDNIDVFFSKLQ